MDEDEKNQLAAEVHEAFDEVFRKINTMTRAFRNAGHHERIIAGEIDRVYSYVQSGQACFLGMFPVRRRTYTREEVMVEIGKIKQIILDGMPSATARTRTDITKLVLHVDPSHSMSLINQALEALILEGFMDKVWHSRAWFYTRIL